MPRVRCNGAYHREVDAGSAPRYPPLPSLAAPTHEYSPCATLQLNFVSVPSIVASSSNPWCVALHVGTQSLIAALRYTVCIYIYMCDILQGHDRGCEPFHLLQNAADFTFLGNCPRDRSLHPVLKTATTQRNATLVERNRRVIIMLSR